MSNVLGLESRRVPKPGVVLCVAGLGAFLAFLDSTVVNVAFPSIAASFRGTSLAELSWVLNAYNIAFAGFLVAGGRFADLLGRRRVFAAGTVLFTLASAGCAIAPSVGLLIAFRAVQGIGCALLVPASLGAVIEAFPGERGTRGVTLWGAAAALAAGLGPPVGGALVDLGDWRWAFVINLPLGGLAVLLSGRTMIESRAPGRRLLPDLPGTALLAAGAALLTVAIVQGARWGWTSSLVVGFECVAALALVTFVVRNRRHPVPVLDPALLRSRVFAIGNLVTIVGGAGFYAYGLTHILWLRYVWGYSLLDAGLAVAPGALVAAVSAALLGRVADRIGHRPVVVLGALVWGAALFWYATRVGVRPDFLGQWLPAQLISGVGIGATLPVVAAAAVRGIAGGRYAAASAALSCTRQFGAVLGVAILVAIVGAPTPSTAVGVLRHGWAFSAACFAACAVLALLLGPDRPSTGTAGPPAAPFETPPRRPRPGRVPAAAPPPAPASFLDSLAAPARERLDEEMVPVALAAGEVLFRAGDPGDGLYVVRSGKLEVVIDDAVVTTRGAGDLLGELSLLTGAARTASIRARRDTTLAYLSTEAFVRATTAEPSVAIGVARATAERLQQVTPSPQPPAAPSVIAVVAADEHADVDAVAAVAEAIVGHLRQHLKVVDPGHVDADGLRRAENDCDRVVLVAGWTPASWREFCLRSADRVVLVASVSHPPAGVLPAVGVRDLVLTRGGSERSALLAWHAAVRPRSTHVLRPADDPADALAPLGRRLAGRSVGLVLAGGGARSLAHIGVLETLAAAGVVVDRVSGTSGGAIIGALLALGLEPSAVDAVAYEEFVRGRPLGDLAVPARGLIRGARVDAAIRRHVGDRLIEELPLEFHATSVDLVRRRVVVHSRGPVADAVAASIRIPGVFAPLPLDDGLHVDGAVLDNLPIGPLIDVPDGPVVAVTLRRDPDPRDRARIPSIGETMTRTMFLASERTTEASLARADVVISPDTSAVGLLEWHQIDALRDAGRRAARAAVPAVLRALEGYSARR